jgi:Ca-activated chloride channel family protein
MRHRAATAFDTGPGRVEHREIHMKRWQMTLGLTGAALVAAALAPRLTAILAPPPPAPEPPPIEPVEPVAAVDTGLAVEQGRLIVDAGLDRPAILKGTASERFLTISVRAPELGGTPVDRPVNVAVVMDASGSMSEGDKMRHARTAAKSILRAMGPEDEFALVSFNDYARVVVESGPVQDVDRISRQIDRVAYGGATNLYDGLARGEAQVLRALTAGEVGRVIVLSDGKANQGRQEPHQLSGLAAEVAAKGISVTTLGLGLDFREDVLQDMADVGGGNYAFIDDPTELADVFARELNETTRLLARNTTLTVDLPPQIEPIEVIGWDAERTDTGWTLFLGDLPAGAERTVVARVRVTANDAGAFDAANVVADYTDLVDDVVSQSSDTAVASVTVDPNAVKASIDREKAAIANRAWGNRYLELSTRAWASGDTETAREMIHVGRAVIEHAIVETGDASLEDDASRLEHSLELFTTESVRPSSNEGRRAIKMNKERARAAYR